MAMVDSFMASINKSNADEKPVELKTDILNDAQKNAINSAITNDITYIWKTSS